MKKLSVDVVNTVAEFLILTFGKTTTLDTKMMLRKLGFDAKQAEVSALLAKIKTDRESGVYEEYVIDGKAVDLTAVDTTTGGVPHKVYSFVDNTPAAVAPKTAAPSPVAPAAAKSTKLSPRDYIAKNRNVDSASLARTLGISKGSVAAYKANLNR